MLLQQKFLTTGWQSAVIFGARASSRTFELGSSSEGTWTEQDLATCFAIANRWGGQTVWPCPLSMAQHALTVLELYQRGVKRQGLIAPTAKQLLGVLLQDADKAILGNLEEDAQDCRTETREYPSVANRIRSAIQKRYGISPRSTVESVCYLHADQQASASEAVYVAGWKSSEVVELLRIGIPPLEIDPLIGIYGGSAWEPWSKLDAIARFLDKLQALRAAALQSV